LIAIGKLAARTLPHPDILDRIEFRDFGGRGMMVISVGTTMVPTDAIIDVRSWWISVR
jgi:hypothetical protein